MNITITTNDEAITDIKIDDNGTGKATFENVSAVLFCLLENFTKQVIDSIKDDESEMDSLFSFIAGACDNLCDRCFPDMMNEEEFGLSEAAILYAEDQIIKRAEKKGITFEEALAQYEKKAKKYVREHSGVMN